MKKIYMLIVFALLYLPQDGYGFDKRKPITILLNTYSTTIESSRTDSNQNKSNKIKGKIAERLKVSLESKEIKVVVNNIDTTEKNIAQVNKLGVNLYLGIKVSKGTRSCIIYHIPSLNALNNSVKSVEDMKEQLISMAKHEDSLTIAGKMSLLTKKTYSSCNEIYESEDTALTRAPCPAILLDLALIDFKNDALLSIVDNDILLNKLVKEIAQAINEFYFE